MALGIPAIVLREARARRRSGAVLVDGRSQCLAQGQAHGGRGERGKSSSTAAGPFDQELVAALKPRPKAFAESSRPLESAPPRLRSTDIPRKPESDLPAPAPVPLLATNAMLLCKDRTSPPSASDTAQCSPVPRPVPQE